MANKFHCEYYNKIELVQEIKYRMYGKFEEVFNAAQLVFYGVSLKKTIIKSIIQNIYHLACLLTQCFSHFSDTMVSSVAVLYSGSLTH